MKSVKETIGLVVFIALGGFVSLAGHDIGNTPSAGFQKITTMISILMMGIGGATAFFSLYQLRPRISLDKIRLFILLWRARRRRIKNAPGLKLLSIVEFFFSPTTVEETFKPTVADWHSEYFEALKQKKFWRARWISVRYTYRFIVAMGLSKVLFAIRSVARR